jgi:N-methylhydantoinase B/oxoprolinase/acetone carboxylase alpha subunit
MSRSRSTATLDPVTLEVCRNRLVAVVTEHAAALQRTSFSLRLPGGGGCGNPLARDPALARRDLEAGHVALPR